VKYLEYIDRTLLLKQQLDKIVRSSEEWSEIVDLVQKNEMLFNQFKKINAQLDEKISKYQTGRIGIDREEIVEFNGLLVDTSFKLKKIEPFLSKEKPNDDLDLESDLKPNLLFKSWEKSLNYVRTNMKLNEIDTFQNKLECFVETATRLVQIKRKYNAHQQMINTYKGLLNDLKKKYADCDQLLESDMIVDKMNYVVDLLSAMSSGEKEFMQDLSRLESGKYNAKSLVNRWNDNDQVIKSSMKISEVKNSSEATLTLLKTTRNLLRVKSTMNMNENIINGFAGIEKELQNEFRDCYTLSHSKELAVKLTNILEGLERNKKLEQTYNKHLSIVSDEDKSKIENLFNFIKNKISSDQLNTYNSKLNHLISAIPVKHRDRRILITKIVVGIVIFAIFATLMTLYVVPFFDGLSVNSNVPESKGSYGFLVWITPLVTAVLVVLYKKKIIFK